MSQTGLKENLEEFVGSGHGDMDEFITSKVYQKTQESLHNLASKVNGLGDSERAKNILELSASLAEVFSNINVE